MNIAIFTNTFRPFVGGVTRSIETFVQEYRNRGHEVFIFAPRFEEQEDHEEGIYRVPSIPHFNHTDFSLPLPFSLKVRNIFDDFAPDIVHVQHPFFLGEMGMHLGKQRGIPIVVTYHTQYEKYSHYAPIDSDLVKRWIVNVCTSFCNLCDLVVAPSTDMEKILLSRDVETKIVVTPTGLNLSAYQNPDRKWLRKSLGLDEGRKILVHIGRLTKEKNLAFLFRAAAQAMKEEKRLIFFVAGFGDQERPLQKLSRELGIEERVVFRGKMELQDLINAYAGGDLFVFSSMTETQGIVVLESMATGTPVVSLDAPGVRDVVENGISGYLTSEDIGEFSGKILILIRSPEQHALFSRECVKKAQEFSSSIMADRMLQEYTALLEKPPQTLNTEVHRFKILKGLLQEALRKVRERKTRAS